MIKMAEALQELFILLIISANGRGLVRDHTATPRSRTPSGISADTFSCYSNRALCVKVHFKLIRAYQDMPILRHTRLSQLTPIGCERKADTDQQDIP
jgi:hypothetical protein